jgi:hypothetical protein
MTGARIMNLAVVGGGVAVSRVLLDYFLERHLAGEVVYFIDSFAFYAPAWNEERLSDAALFARAPADPALARILWRSPASRATVLDYAVGFSKINNPARLEPDRPQEEGARYERAYRPVPQIDRQRLDYLYPPMSAAARTEARTRYLAELSDMIAQVHARDMRFTAIRMPLPERVRRALPDEDAFDAALRAVTARHGASLYDFSRDNNAEELFFDTDHLNLDGTLQFFEYHLKQVLDRGREAQ